MGGGPAVDDGWPLVDDLAPGIEAIALPAATDAEATDLLASLFDAHYRSLCRLAYVLLGDPAHAEDVVQEAFLRTFTGLGRLRDRDRADA